MHAAFICILVFSSFLCFLASALIFPDWGVIGVIGTIILIISRTRHIADVILEPTVQTHMQCLATTAAYSTRVRCICKTGVDMTSETDICTPYAVESRSPASPSMVPFTCRGIRTPQDKDRGYRYPPTVHLAADGKGNLRSMSARALQIRRGLQGSRAGDLHLVLAGREIAPARA